MLKSIFAAAAFTGSFYYLPFTANPKKTAHYTAPGITAEYDAKKKTVLIKWQQSITGIKTFVVQRSPNNTTWADIARMDNKVYTENTVWQYADSNPAEGENYYRLQSVSSTGKKTHSNSVMVITGVAGKWVMYPVPVGDVLTLQYKGTVKITGVINVHLQSIQGYALAKLRYASNTTIIQIPVANLGKGVYDVRITIEGNVVWNQRFVK